MPLWIHLVPTASTAPNLASVSSETEVKVRLEGIRKSFLGIWNLGARKIQMCRYQRCYARRDLVCRRHWALGKQKICQREYFPSKLALIM